MALADQYCCFLHALMSSVSVHPGIDTNAGTSKLYSLQSTESNIIVRKARHVHGTMYDVRSQTLFVLELGIIVILAGLSKQHV